MWELDMLGAEPFRQRVAPLFEDAPRFLERLVEERPFGSWETLFGRAQAIALSMSEAEQAELIDAHPRIGSAVGVMSPMSAEEQGLGSPMPEVGGPMTAPGVGGPMPQRVGSSTDQAVGDPMTLPGVGGPTAQDVDQRQRTLAELERLNAAYEARFGFRYVVFVAGRPLADIVPLMQAALSADRDSEKQRALLDIIAIARDRASRLGLLTARGA